MSERVADEPRLWLLMGHKAGDNAQVEALAEAVGWPAETKRFVYRRTELLTNRLLGVTLRGIVPAASSALAPPWPDIVVTAGRRNEPVARWIQRQAAPGKRVRLVHLGRPWAPLDAFDLVVTTPQYHLPARANVLLNRLPLHRISPERLLQAADVWRPRLQDLPRPWFSVLVGGSAGPYRFDAVAARRLAREAGRQAASAGGSLLVTTSARTDAAAADALAAALDVPHRLHRWKPADPDNPYLGFLALADAQIVTAESMSMVAEACATGKPVYLFDLGEGWRALRRDRGGWLDGRDAFDRGAFGLRLFRDFGPRRMARDVRLILDRLLAERRVAWLGEGEPSPAVSPPDDVERAAARVRALLQP